MLLKVTLLALVAVVYSSPSHYSHQQSPSFYQSYNSAPSDAVTAYEKKSLASVEEKISHVEHHSGQQQQQHQQPIVQVEQFSAPVQQHYSTPVQQHYSAPVQQPSQEYLPAQQYIQPVVHQQQVPLVEEYTVQEYRTPVEHHHQHYSPPQQTYLPPVQHGPVKESAPSVSILYYSGDNSHSSGGHGGHGSHGGYAPGYGQQYHHSQPNYHSYSYSYNQPQTSSYQVYSIKQAPEVHSFSIPSQSFSYSLPKIDFHQTSSYAPSYSSGWTSGGGQGKSGWTTGGGQGGNGWSAGGGHGGNGWSAGGGHGGNGWSAGGGHGGNGWSAGGGHGGHGGSGWSSGGGNQGWGSW